MKECLCLENLTVSYGREEKEREVVCAISFPLYYGETLALMGESGAGKSSIAKAILGLLPASASVKSGKLRFFDGLELDLAESGRWKEVRGKRLALVNQDAASALSPSLKIRGHFRLLLKGDEDYAVKALALLEKLGFEEPGRVLDSYPFELSGGMCQRVCIALALSLDPQAIIADEPTSALDGESRDSVLAIFRRLNRELDIPVLLITHDYCVAKSASDRIIILKDGKAVEEGPSEDIFLSQKSEYAKELFSSFFLPDYGGDGKSGIELLRVNGVYKSFHKNRVLRDVSFDLKENESLGLLGPSGSGKSTIVRSIERLEKPSSGAILFRGNAIENMKRREIASCIQMVFQDARSSLNPSRPALAIVQEALVYQKKGDRKEREERSREMLEHCGLDSSCICKRPPELSTGQCQRVALARALVARPQLLICDEMLSSLDLILQKQIIELLNELRRQLGFSMLMISHDERVVKACCGRFIYLEKGCIIASGETSTLDRTLEEARRME